MQQQLPEWESDLIDEAIRAAEQRFKDEQKQAARAKKRALQLAREQGYHRLAAEIDRPTRKAAGPGQLRLFKTDNTLFDDAG
jgi:hypothetical protein